MVLCSPEWLKEHDHGGQHSAFIEANLEELQKKCDEFHQCTMELYKAENFHRVLAGEPLQLSNICGLMYPEGEEMYTTRNQSLKCSKSERDAIRQDIGRRLSREMTGRDKDQWKELDDCVKRNSNASESAIDTVCRLAETETNLCGNANVHHKAEDYFNHEMEHLHCSCAAIRAQTTTTPTTTEKGPPVLPPELRIAVGCGVIGLILVLFIVVIVLCIRHRKVKKRLKQHRIQYLPSPHDDGSAIYQEINDGPPGWHNGKGQSDQSDGYRFLGRAPSLPERYVKTDLSRSRNNLTSPGDEEREYLEPLPDNGSDIKSPASRANMGYGTPRTLAVKESAYDLARHPANVSPTRPPVEGDYFDHLQLRDNADEDGGYSTLGRKRVPSDDAQHAPQGAEDRQYFVLEPQDDVTSETETLRAVTPL